MVEKQHWVALACGLLALTGCGGSSVNPIGGGPSAGAPSGSPTGSGGTSSSGAVPSLAEQLAGTWLGYVENYEFYDQSDAVKLVLHDDRTGEITFGKSAEPPPPSDPDVGYPPVEMGIHFSEDQQGSPYDTPAPGFRFTLQNVSEEGSRLQFDINAIDVWAQWCPLQTPVLVETGDENSEERYLCVSSWPSLFGPTCKQNNPNDGQEWITVDCGKLYLCNHSNVCECTAEGCKVAAGSLTHFDLNLNLPKANGTVAGLDLQLHNLRLTKQ